MNACFKWLQLAEVLVVAKIPVMGSTWNFSSVFIYSSPLVQTGPRRIVPIVRIVTFSPYSAVQYV